MIAQASPGAKGPWASRKGAEAPFFHLWENHIIKLRMMLRMTDRQPVLVYLRIYPVHSTMVYHHRPCSNYDSALQRKVSVAVVSRSRNIPHPCTYVTWPPLTSLTWHAGLAFHCAGLINVSREAITPEEAYQGVHRVLQPVRIYGSDHAVTGIKKSQAAIDVLSHPVEGHLLIFYRQGRPRLNDIVYKNVE